MVIVNFDVGVRGEDGKSLTIGEKTCYQAIYNEADAKDIKFVCKYYYSPAQFTINVCKVNEENTNKATKSGKGGNGGKQGERGLAGQIMLFDLDQKSKVKVQKKNGKLSNFA